MTCHSLCLPPPHRLTSLYSRAVTITPRYPSLSIPDHSIRPHAYWTFTTRFIVVTTSGAVLAESETKIWQERRPGLWSRPYCRSSSASIALAAPHSTIYCNCCCCCYCSLKQATVLKLDHHCSRSAIRHPYPHEDWKHPIITIIPNPLSINI
jgi:hypothetical protein